MVSTDNQFRLSVDIDKSLPGVACFFVRVGGCYIVINWCKSGVWEEVVGGKM